MHREIIRLWFGEKGQLLANSGLQMKIEQSLVKCSTKYLVHD